mgnify:CR=1 FL=1
MSEAMAGARGAEVGVAVTDIVCGIYSTTAILAALHVLSRWLRPERMAERVPPVLFAGGLGATAALALAFLPAEYRPFVYFQF